MRRTLCRLAAQHYASIDLPPLISIANGTFYRQHPSSQLTLSTEESLPEVDANPPLFPGLDFTIPSFSEPKQHWSILSKDAAVRTTFLQILRGQHICLPPTARSYPYLGTADIAKKDPRLRSPSNAIQYVGFDAERGTAGGSGMRGAYMSARYESRKEETDFSLRDYLFGNTELNADETLTRHPDQALVDQIMVDLKLEALESMPVTNLSNGQTRRARIAKALLAKPELLLLDGPFMGLDPPTVQLLANILQRLAEAHSPRLILSLKPDEEYPAWITHTAYLNSNFTVDSLGPRKDIIQSIIQRAKTLWRGTMMDDMTREELDLIAVSNHLRGNEPYPESLGTVADHALYMRTRGQQERAPGKLLKSTVAIHSRDGFTADSAPVPPPGEPLIEMKGVNVKYNDKSVLGDWKQEVDGELKDGLWWNVCRGQRWGVFGANGSGKTTLISLITSDHPQTYSLPITIFGRSRLPQPGQPGISIFDIQSRIGHSSPEVHAFFPKYLSVRRTIESAWADTPLTKPRISYEVDEKVSAALNWFRGELNPMLGPTESQLYDTWKRMYQNGQQAGALAELNQILSDEEQNPHVVDWADEMKFEELSFSAQRVALFIRAVIRNPDLVVLDEAFSGMDDAARDKCHLFLSKGQHASFRIRSTNNNKRVLFRGPAVQESYYSRLGRVKLHGLQEHQALIVISHKKEEVPGCVRDWICLPEPGQGPPRTGQLLVPLELKLGGWDEIWGTKITPLRTAKDEGTRRRHRTPQKLDLSKESPEKRELRLARARDRARRWRAAETPEQYQERLNRIRESQLQKQSKETEEQRQERMVRRRIYIKNWQREQRAKKSTEDKTAFPREPHEACKATTPADADKLREQWRRARQKWLKIHEAEFAQKQADRKKALQSLTAEERLEQNELRNAQLREKRQNESPEQREVRLEKMRAYAKRRREESIESRNHGPREQRQNETPEQRENRLERARADKKRRREEKLLTEVESKPVRSKSETETIESPEKREKRLAMNRAYKKERREREKLAGTEKRPRGRPRIMMDPAERRERQLAKRAYAKIQREEGVKLREEYLQKKRASMKRHREARKLQEKKEAEEKAERKKRRQEESPHDRELREKHNEKQKLYMRRKRAEKRLLEKQNEEKDMEMMGSIAER